jgi:hypothetical protein
MNPIRAIRRLACVLAGLAAGLLALATASPAALARPGPPSAGPMAFVTPQPLPPGWYKHLPLPANPQPALRFPPGWNNHPPLPAHARALATGGMPGWQITLIIVGITVLATAAVALLARARAARRATASPA